MAGGGFVLHADVLPGDADRDGDVDLDDVLAVRDRQGTSTTNPGTAPNTYSPYHDLDGNGAINVFDTVQAKYREGTTLPTGRPGAPAAPAGLTATAASPSQIDLAWSHSAGVEDGYTIERSTVSNFTGPVEFVVGAGAVSFSDTGLAAGTTYYYRIRPYQGATAPTYFGYSGTASATTVAAPPPSAPTALTATPFDGQQVGLAWADNSADEEGFTVQRSASADCSSDVAEFPTFADATSFNDADLTAGTTDHYRVRSFRGADVSAFSNTAIARPFTPPADAVTVTANASGTGVALLWSANPEATSYNIYRAQGDGTPSLYLSGLTGTTFSDDGLPSDTRFAYAVAPVGPGGEGPLSPAASTATAPPYAADNRGATGVTAVALSDTKVAIVWEDNAKSERGFRVRRRKSGTLDFVDVGQVGPDLTRFDDTSVTPGTSHEYTVTAFNDAGNAWPSLGSYVSVPLFQGPPAAPTGVAARAVSLTRFAVSWTDNSDNETGFEIGVSHRFVGNSPDDAVPTKFVIQKADAGLTIALVDVGTPVPPLEYLFAVRFVNALGTSAWSDVATARQDFDLTVPKPLPPEYFKIHPAFYWDGVELVIGTTGYNIDGFEVELTPEGGQPELYWVDSSQQYRDVVLVREPNTRYSGRIRSYNAGGWSEWVEGEIVEERPPVTGDYPVPQTPIQVTARVVPQEEDADFQVEVQYPASAIGPNTTRLLEIATDPYFASRTEHTGTPPPPSTPDAWTVLDNNAGSFRVRGLQVGATYYFRVKVSVKDTVMQHTRSRYSDAYTAVPEKIISSSPPTFAVDALDPVAAEEGRNPARFVVRRSGWDLAPASTVLTRDDTGNAATPEEDYDAFPLKVSFAARQIAAIVEVNPVDDKRWEPAEHVTFVNADGRKAAATITSNDHVDLDVDSDNTNGTGDPDRNRREEDVEAVSPSKIVPVNDDDANRDGVPDFATPFNIEIPFENQRIQDARFIPVSLEIPEGIDLSKARFRVSYAASDPSGVIMTLPGQIEEENPSDFVPAPGYLRLWMENAWVPRDGNALAEATGGTSGWEQVLQTRGPSSLSLLGKTAFAERRWGRLRRGGGGGELGGQAGGGDATVDAGQQALDGEPGLGDHLTHVQIAQAVELAALGDAGQHDHRQAAEAVPAADGPQERQAVHLRHHQVEHHQVRRRVAGGLQCFQRLHPVGRAGGLVAFIPQQPCQGFAGRWVVVHDENPTRTHQRVLPSVGPDDLSIRFVTGHGKQGAFENVVEWSVVGWWNQDCLSYPTTPPPSTPPQFLSGGPLEADHVAVRVFEPKLPHPVGRDGRRFGVHAAGAEVGVGRVEVAAAEEQGGVIMGGGAYGVGRGRPGAVLVGGVQHQCDAVEAEQAPVKVVGLTLARPGRFDDGKPEHVVVKRNRPGHVEHLDQRGEALDL